MARGAKLSGIGDAVFGFLHLNQIARGGSGGDLVALIVFGGLCYLLFRTARKSINEIGS